MPKKREKRYDKSGQLTKMAEADGWVMVRHPRAVPFAITIKDWNAMIREPKKHEPQTQPM